MKIDDKYSAVSDTYGWTLVFEEKREKIKKDLSKEIYLYKDYSYYPTLKACLRRYMDLSVKELGTAEEVLKRLEKVEDAIKNLKIK